MLPSGATWTNVGSTGYMPIVDLLWIAKTLYALTDAGEVLRSQNNGATWSAIGTISQVGMRDLAFVGGAFKAISKEGEVYESATGASWSSEWIGTTGQVFTVAFAPGVPEFQTGVEGPIPGTPRLAFSAWPNPFVERVEFRLSREGVAGDATVEVFDAAGRSVTRARFATAAGSDAVTAAWDGGRSSSGVYFARVQSGTFRDTVRIVLLR
jgi:hypothetical protein